MLKGSAVMSLHHVIEADSVVMSAMSVAGYTARQAGHCCINSIG